MNTLPRRQENILASAREDGMIPFPPGSARTAEAVFRIIEDLARQGYVEYARKTWYRAYWLTNKGRQLACALQENPRRHFQLEFKATP